MSQESKLRLLGEQAVFDLSCACGLDPGRKRARGERWIYPTAMPDGSRQATLKVLLDNRCQNDCAFCAQRARRNTRRDAFEPEELARLYIEMHRAGRVKALFLSSGLGGDAVRTMDRMLATVEILRRRFEHRGFVHLKVLPGAQREQVQQAARLAQRLSINLEAPSAARMRALSLAKDFAGDILERAAWIAEAVADERSLARSHTTQFVVGASGETDREIVLTADRLYRGLRLGRAYYSKFQPVADTPLAEHPATPFIREHRLYQVDFLLRRYGFGVEEIPFEADGGLCVATDPKTRWAELNRGLFPVEVNRAERAMLLRVPGLGPRSVERLMGARRQGRLTSARELQRLGVRLKAAGPWLLVDGRLAGRDRQLELFRAPLGPGRRSG